jgi:hypothetical protein
LLLRSAILREATISALALSLFTSCSAATPVDDDADTVDAGAVDADDVEAEGCHFTHEDDSGREPFECVISPDSDETCRDAGLCFCNAMHPGASEEELEGCMWEWILPRAMITLSDYCWPGVPMSLAEALTSWAADRGAMVVTDEACDDMPATLTWP